METSKIMKDEDRSMKKAIALILTLALIPACFAGCKKKTPTPEDTTNTGKVELNIPDSPVEDFSYRVENDEITITKYKGSDREVGIPETIEGKKVTKLGYIFYNNENVVSVKMPDTVISIQYDAFLNCTALTTVDLSDSLESIGKSAFKNCAALTNISLPDSLTTIDEEAFSDCASLKKITIPKSLTTSYMAFVDSGLENVKFEDGLTVIGYGMFARTNLKEVVIPASVKTIKASAFGYCEKLESVTLNEGLITIGYKVFTGTKVKEITIPKSVVNIDENTFYDCPALEKVIFEGDAPENYAEYANVGINVHYTVFYHPEAKGFTSPLWNGYKSQAIGCESVIKEFSGFTYVENADNGITIMEYTGSDTDVVIPEKIDGKAVTTIGYLAFTSCDKVVSVKIPDTVTVIEQQAFESCKALESVELSGNLKVIGICAFWACQQLSRIDLPDTLTSLGIESFANCDSLKSIRVPKSLTDFGGAAFFCTGIESVEFEDGLEMIGEAAFSGTKLKDVVLPASMRTISDQAFASCPLESVTLNEGLVTIGDSVFSALYSSCSIKEIVIPSSVKNITDKTFNYSTLEKVKFEGDAPENFISGEDVRGADYTIYYHEGAEGFTSPEWNGYPTEIW